MNNKFAYPELREIVETKVFDGDDLIVNHCINYDCPYMDIAIEDEAIEFYQQNVGLFKRVNIEDVDMIEIVRHDKEGRIMDIDVYENERTIPRIKFCVMCDKCKYHVNSGVKDNVCFYYEFWHDDVLNGREHHLIDIDRPNTTMSFTIGEGGFGNRRYDIEFEDGEKWYDVGLWHRGSAPDSVAKQIRKAKITPRNRR